MSDCAVCRKISSGDFARHRSPNDAVRIAPEAIIPSSQKTTVPVQHMCYFEFRLFAVGVVCAAIAGGAFCVTAITYARDNYTLMWENDLNMLWHGYTNLACTKEPWPSGLPSILRMKELRAEPNVCVRMAIMIPFSVRCFAAYCQYCLLLLDSRQPMLTAVFGALLTPIAFVELLCASMAIMLNVRIDGEIYYKFALFLFGFFSIIHMMILTMLQAFSRTFDKLSLISLAIKAITLITYLAFMPIFFRHHLTLLRHITCHPIVPTFYALLEYGSLVSNALFHLTALIDLRHVRYTVITEQCECEPLVNERDREAYAIEPAYRCTHRKRQEEERIANDRRMG